VSRRGARLRLTGRNNDDDEQDEDADKQAHAHLHILPPHLLADAICASSEALGGGGEVVGLVLQRVEASSSLRDLVDVVPHDADGAVDFLPRKTLATNKQNMHLAGGAAGQQVAECAAVSGS